MPLSARAGSGAGSVLTPGEAVLLAAALPLPGLGPLDDEPAGALALPSPRAVAAALVIAVLAVEGTGTATLAAGRRRRWFGLWSVAVAELRATELSVLARAPWPAASLEARLDAALRAAPGDAPPTVSLLAGSLLAPDPAPAERLATATFDALVQRGVLLATVVETSRLRLLPARARYYHPVRGAAEACALAQRRADVLAEECRATRAALWSLLLEATDTAIRRATLGGGRRGG